jgi:hypothetical protein
MDHSRVHISTTAMSCGIAELSGWKTDDPKGLLYQLASYLYHPSRGSPVAFFVWSTVVQDEFLINLVRELDLGGVVCSDVQDNPKTGNAIRVITWSIDHETLRKWYRNERVKRAKGV